MSGFREVPGLWSQIHLLKSFWFRAVHGLWTVQFKVVLQYYLNNSTIECSKNTKRIEFYPTKIITELQIIEVFFYE